MMIVDTISPMRENIWRSVVTKKYLKYPILQYKNGRVTETVFEKFEILEKIISNRVDFIEEKISKSRVRSLLSQALNVAGDVIGDEAVGVKNILSEGIKVLDELGILLFQPYCLRWAFNVF